MTRRFNAFSQYLDSNGAPVSGGNVTVYLAGTTDLIELFTDDSLDPEFALENPFTLDDKGAAPPEIHYEDNISTKELIKTAANVLYSTTDNIPPLGGANSSAMLYSASTTYGATERVLSAGIWYFSNVSGNKGNDPLSSPSFWTPEHILREYNNLFSYAMNATTFEDGIPYQSRIASNLDNLPSESPTQWANISGVGIQTINIPAGTMNLPKAADDPATVDTGQIGDFVVITKEFVGSITEENTQFSVDMPESWDRGELQIVYRLVSRGTVDDGISAVFGVSAVGFGSGETITAENFGPLTKTAITGITAQDNFYVSDTTTFIPDLVSTANRIVFFKITRDLTGISDPDFLALDQAIDTLTELILTASAGDVQAIAANVSLTSGQNTSSATFTITGTDQTGSILVEAITGPNATTVMTLGLFSTVTEIAYTPVVAGATIEAGYTGGNTVTSDLGLVSVRILYTTVSSTDNA